LRCLGADLLHDSAVIVVLGWILRRIAIASRMFSALL